MKHKAINRKAYEKNIFLGKATGTGRTVFENVRLEEITDEQIDSWGGETWQGIDWGYFPDPLRLRLNALRRANTDALYLGRVIFVETRQRGSV